MRGKHYSARRAWLERVLGRAYAGDWPARVWAFVPGATSRGVGTTELPIRKFAPADVLLVELVSA